MLLSGIVNTLPLLLLAQAVPESPGFTRAYWHLFAAFGIAWIALLGYAIFLARRFRRLEERVSAE